MMEHQIDDECEVPTPAEQFAAARAELLNAKALIDKLQTLLDSKTHQVEALHKEVENLRATLEAATTSADAWQKRVQAAEAARAEMAGVLITAAEPDIDTVPLADLLEAIGTYIEHDQSVTIRGSYEAVRQVEIHALGLTFSVDTHEAGEALTKLQELGGCLVQEA